jgi:hypothetical protein
MQKPYKIILAISMLATLGMFIHEWVYDNPGSPYSAVQIVQDIIFGGIFYLGVLFSILSGLFCLFSALFKSARQIINR